jgi:hypothetical protein
MFSQKTLAFNTCSPPTTFGDLSLPVVLRPVYSGDGLLTGEEGAGTSTDVADFAGENDGTGEGVGGAASVKIISSWTSAMNRKKGELLEPKVKVSCL